MKSTRPVYLIIAVATAVILWACVPTSVTPTENEDTALLETSVAETVIAQVTRSAIETMIAQLTEVASQPSATPVPPTPSPLPTFTPVPPTPTPLPPTATATPGLCDWAELVADLSPITNPVVLPGTTFSKVWRLRNVGYCAWNTAYELAFTGGDLIGAPPFIALPYSVLPGEMVDISVQFTAPFDPGVYLGNWMLRNTGGGLFGLGPFAQTPLQAQVQVVGASIGGDVYNLAQNYCRAQWYSQAGLLPCPGSTDDVRGSVRLLSAPQLESRQENELALWVRPYQSEDGWISGQYPVYPVRNGDHFISEVGCLDNSPGCDVTFQLNYRLLDGTTGNLGSWREVLDGESTSIDVDLSAFRGQSMEFFLEVFNIGRFTSADAFWFMPQIRNTSPTSELVLNWRLEGGVNDVCDELRVYLFSDDSGEAQASSCEDGYDVLGDTALSDAEVERLRSWVNWYAPFEGSTYTPSSGEAEITTISFNGGGDAEAFTSDIQAMQRFAEQLFAEITR